jgi:hypothetical protein
MGDGTLQSAVDNREYPIVVVSNSNQPGTTVNKITRSLFKKLKGIAVNDPSLSVSIEDLGSNREESPSWAITAKSPGKIKRYLLNEFCSPPTKGPKFFDYLAWILRAPVRTANYLSYRLRESMETGSRRQKVRALFYMLPSSVMLAFQVLAFFYFMPIISLTVIDPLRRWSLRITAIYFFFIATVVVLATWKSIVPPFVTEISQITQQLIDLVPSTKLSFDLLFPVIAAIIFGAVVSVIIFLLRATIQAVRRADERPIATLGAVAFAYLLDPLYAATARVAFEKMLLKAGNREETRDLFVICEHGGILLTYEVLSRRCSEKINRPIHLLTHNMDLAGLQVGPRAMLWLMVEPTDWSRFARTTPYELSWHHWMDWPSEEYIFKINSISQDEIPQVQRESIRKAWLKSSQSMLVDRLIALTDQS